MCTPDSNNTISNKVQLVALDTHVHKSQKFIEAQTIPVSFEDDNFHSCAIVSDSQVLVFISWIVILVDMDNKSQTVISKPEGIGRIDICLNMMKDDTPLIICECPEFEYYLEEQIRQQYPNQTHELICDEKGGYLTHLVTQFQYDLQERQFKNKIDLSVSVIVDGDRIRSILP